MTKARPAKRTVRIIRAPWLSLRRHLRRRTGGLKLGRRKRHVGFILLGILLALIGLYFYLTNPENLRTSAKQYLERIVNGRVEVGRASFGFARGIKLADIRISTRNGAESTEAIFTADSINLKINWGSLLSGRFAATRISAFRPQVFLVEDSTGRWNYEDLFRKRVLKMPKPLPRIILREGQIHYAEQVKSRHIPGGTFDFAGDFEPSTSAAHEYFGQIETTQSGKTVAVIRGHFDTISGTFSKIAAQISLTSTIRQSLPRRAREWMDKYDISGQVTVSGDYSPKAETSIIAKLEGVTCCLPLSESTSVEISDVHGQLQFNEEGVTLGILESGQGEPLRFKALGGDWELSGKTIGYQSEPDFDLQVECDELALPSNANVIEALPEVCRRTLREWNAAGTISLQVNVSRTKGNYPPIRSIGFIRCLDVSGSFKHFPYKVENVEGLIKIAPQEIKLEYMKAIHRSRNDPSKVVHLAAEGEVIGPADASNADIIITAKDVLIDEELREALHPKKRIQWDLFDPSGRADIACRLLLRAGQEPKWETYIEGVLKDVEFTFRDFPYKLSGLCGRLHVGPKHIELGRPRRESEQGIQEQVFVTGQAGKAPVKLYCLINDLEKDDQSVLLNFAADGLLLDDQLVQALPSEARKFFDTFSPSGPADISGVISTSKANSENLDFLIDLRPMGISCRYKEFPYPLEQGRGHVRLRPGRLEILDFSAKHGQASFTVKGSAASSDETHYQADISITGRDIPLDETAYESLKPEHQRIWDDLQPEGKCDVNIAITDKADGSLSHKTQIIPRGVTINYKHVPYKLSDLTGELIIQPGIIDVDMHDTQQTTSIKGKVEQQGEKRSVQFSVSAKNVAINEKFKEVLPAKAKAIWETVWPTGQIDVRIDSLSYVADASTAAKWNGTGAVELKSLALSRPVSCENLSGSISGSLQSDQDGTQLGFQGQLTLPELSLGALKLKNLSGLFSKDSSAQKWSLTDIRAELSGGRLLGDIETTKAVDGQFSATLIAEDVQLAQLIAEFESANPGSPGSEGQRTGNIQGRLRASIKLEGKLGDSASTSGRGKVYVDQAQLYQLPLMGRVLQTLSLQPSDPNAFNTATVDFYLRDNSIVFTEIILDGPSLRMIGTGIYDRPGDSINIVMVREPPEGILSNLPPLPEAVVAEITGSLADPQVQDRPFRAVSEELKKLFQKRKPRE